MSNVPRRKILTLILILILFLAALGVAGWTVISPSSLGLTQSPVTPTPGQPFALVILNKPSPVQEASRLKPGLPVHLVDDRGEVFATERLSFVSASVDGAMQSVLAKATLESASGLRTEQIVRARIVWSEAPALTAPIVALNRIA